MTIKASVFMIEKKERHTTHACTHAHTEQIPVVSITRDLDKMFSKPMVEIQ